ncbi:MAG: HEPN domain-containing protein, partial [Deltaproteobacteria bacterium]
MRSAIENWIASGDYDFKTAVNLFKSRRYIYVVFLCHLAIEKILKAIVCMRLNEMPPYTHNLNRLVELAGTATGQTHLNFTSTKDFAQIV